MEEGSVKDKRDTMLFTEGRGFLKVVKGERLACNQVGPGFQADKGDSAMIVIQELCQSRNINIAFERQVADAFQPFFFDEFNDFAAVNDTIKMYIND